MATETPPVQLTGYRETISEGRSWVRCKTMHINNDLGGHPSVVFGEERVVEIEGETIQRHLGEIVEMFDPAGTIDLFHPVSNAPMGKASQGMLQVMLYSLYHQSARKRDAREAAEKTRQEEAVAQQVAMAAAAAALTGTSQ
jgi:hypothetical protein